MSRLRAILTPVAIVATGCTTTSASRSVNSVLAPISSSTGTPDSPPRKGTVESTRPPATQFDAVKLEAFEVKESAFSDFGMSVKTNLEVKWGGTVEWMQVSAVDATSSASTVGLRAGDRILAIDGLSVTALNRNGMLDTLFARKKGESARMLVLGQKEALPHFVRLVANPPARDRQS